VRFTIVTPSYNQLDWLRLCVASVADQIGARPPRRFEGSAGADGGISVEHIIQDAGSNGIENFARMQGADFFRDGILVPSNGGESAEASVARGISKRKDRYSLAIYCEKDAGMYDAVNRGLRRGTGEICAYLNCDEQYLPQTLARVAEYFSALPPTDILFGAAIVTKADGGYVCDRRVTIPTRWHTLISGNLSFFTSSCFFRRDSVVGCNLLFDPDWRVCGDAVWAIRLMEARLHMRTTSIPLSVFAETGQNLSSQANRGGGSETIRLQKLAPLAARVLKPVVLLAHRARRWRTGAYRLLPHSYRIYTKTSPDFRRLFNVEHPAFRWRAAVE
jgi:glycosyltransferase involved in cell wall biosynthesis